ncbi:MAG: IscS subfamily cysteine desulfurase [Gracilimonas sp.]|uniref:IscS subfamily cysteine desulfurase n=1 Tax=Gracilimonas sp. TaxID=1974203 RepID=UPI0037513805|nr:IscS subfamily cysteine desulfurase [Gracilimonas sp.]
MIYLDHAATTPMSGKALEVYVNVAKHYFGNASSLHDEGSAAKQILEASAKTIASTLNARPQDVHFNSGATEGNNLAINSLLKAKQGRHIITSEIEHSSVRNVFLKLEQEGYEVTRLPVDESGFIKFKILEESIRKDTALVSLQHVNSEIGTIQEIQKIGSFLQKQGTLFHSDCVQSYGRLPLDIKTLNVDALTISSHKIYGPKGAGAVWMNPTADWKSVFPGHDNTSRFRAGTADVPSIAAFAIAAKERISERESEQERIRTFKEKLLSEIKKMEFEVEVEGASQQSVPNILGLRFPGMEGQFMMLECNQAGLAISTGSACQAGSDKPNKTMVALGKNEQEAREFIRLSFGKENEEHQIPLIIEKMNSILNRHFDKVNYYKTK